MLIAQIQVFDFDQLNKALKDRRHSNRDKIKVEFKQKMDALIYEIERIAPIEVIVVH